MVYWDNIYNNIKKYIDTTIETFLTFLWEKTDDNIKFGSKNIKKKSQMVLNSIDKHSSININISL